MMNAVYEGGCLKMARGFRGHCPTGLPKLAPKYICTQGSMVDCLSDPLYDRRMREVLPVLWNVQEEFGLRKIHSNRDGFKVTYNSLDLNSSSTAMVSAQAIMLGTRLKR